MSKSTYKYEIAFSFLSQDEQLALDLEKHFKNRYSTFLYSAKQEILAGKDGTVAFTQVFNKECRLAVVLFRSGWGENGMTLIEKNAIQNRYLDEGYKFILFVLLEEKDRSKLPVWYPSNYIWYGYQHYGLLALFSAIDNKIIELGGVNSPNTPTLSAKQTNDIIELRDYRHKILKTLYSDSVTLAEKEIKLLFSLVTAKVDEYNMCAKIKMHYAIENDNRLHFEIFHIKLIIEWICPFGNSLEGSRLQLTAFSGFLNNNPNYLYRSEDELDVIAIERLGWKTSLSRLHIVDTISYSGLIFDKYISIVQKAIKK